MLLSAGEVGCLFINISLTCCCLRELTSSCTISQCCFNDKSFTYAYLWAQNLFWGSVSSLSMSLHSLESLECLASSWCPICCHTDSVTNVGWSIVNGRPSLVVGTTLTSDSGLSFRCSDNIAIWFCERVRDRVFKDPRVVAQAAHIPLRYFGMLRTGGLQMFQYGHMVLVRRLEDAKSTFHRLKWQHNLTFSYKLSIPMAIQRMAPEGWMVEIFLPLHLRCLSMDG